MAKSVDILIRAAKHLKVKTELASMGINFNSNVTRFVLVMTWSVLYGTISRPGDALFEKMPLKPGAHLASMFALKPCLFFQSSKVKTFLDSVSRVKVKFPRYIVVISGLSSSTRT